MTRFLLTFLVLLLGVHEPALSSESGTFAPESDTRSAVATVPFIEDNGKSFYQFVKELEKNYERSWGEVREAAEQGRLRTFLCDNCMCRTARLLSDGSVEYWRHLKPEERVAVLENDAIFAIQCGNPVQCTSAPWMKPNMLPPPPTQVGATPPPPPPRTSVAEKRPPRPREGCTPERSSHTSSFWAFPEYGYVPYGWGTYSAGGISWITSYHDWLCHMDANRVGDIGNRDEGED